jgi:uncharacterized protein YjbJ (UPF0337 family)
MKRSRKDEGAGKIHEVKGAAKEKLGALTNNPDLEAEGAAEKVAGGVQRGVQRKIGQMTKILGQ